jgi:hypothetical protein
MPAERPLTRLQLDILELEAQTWRLAGSKHSEFRRRWPNVTETAYYLALSRMLDDERAQRHSPVLVNRLCRLRDEEIARRAAVRSVEAQ